MHPNMAHIQHTSTGTAGSAEGINIAVHAAGATLASLAPGPDTSPHHLNGSGCVIVRNPCRLTQLTLLLLLLVLLPSPVIPVAYTTSVVDAVDVADDRDRAIDAVQRDEHETTTPHDIEQSARAPHLPTPPPSPGVAAIAPAHGMDITDYSQLQPWEYLDQTPRMVTSRSFLPTVAFARQRARARASLYAGIRRLNPSLF